MSDYRFILDTSSKKFLCVSCGEKTAVRYIDKETRNYLPQKYSRCDRVINCAYFLNPYKDGYLKSLFENTVSECFQFLNTKGKETGNATKATVKPISVIPFEVLTQTLNAYQHNSFVSYLCGLFGEQITSNLISKYYIGTSSRWTDATIFWFISIDGSIRAGQVKAFDNTGHTIKHCNQKGGNKSCTTWIHSILEWKYKNDGKPLPSWLLEYLESDNKISCLFGEHLLKKEPRKPVALVEAPKTAIIASVYYPEYLWLATGSLSFFTEKRCQSLRDREVMLFPDLNAFDIWSKKASELAHLAAFSVYDHLEKVATPEEKEQGLDLADYLVRIDYSKLAK